MRRVSALAHQDLVALWQDRMLAGPAHLYLANQVWHELQGGGEPAGTFWGVFGRRGLDTVAFFSRTRLLVVGPSAPRAAVCLRRPALGSERGFRILIGPREPCRALLDELRPRVQVDLDRSQPFFVVEDATRLCQGPEPREAKPSDLDWLAQASLRLNEEDLGIAADTIDTALLRQRIAERQRAGTTFVLDDRGVPACKLEIGSSGPAGALIEGVYTEPAARGRGLARQLVAAVSRRLLARHPRVGLHVARDNAPAIRAYCAAGFREDEDLELAILRWK